MNPYYIETILREKHRDMLAEASRLQLIAAYKAAAPSPQAKLLAALGAKLIQLGERLTQRYDRQSCPPELTLSHTDTI
jgi:hypothetical protein